ncbi:MAG TPA: DJ-1/PfpI family protein [Actinoplanes sp.]|nr:DJ-1/PfpI family protein [Actinoplanes sp.]
MAPKTRNALTTVVRTVVYLLAFLAAPVLVGYAGLNSTVAHLYDTSADPPSIAEPVPVPPEHDPTRPTAVVLMSNAGSQVTDVLAPYEVLARAGAFNLYTAAAAKQPVPLGGGLDVLPHLSFAELDQRLHGADPDLIVVPAMPGAPGAAAAGIRPVTDWLRRHAGDATTVLSVCNGAEVVAGAGLAAGRRITANWAGIDALRKRHPEAQWVRGRRYVEDGNLVSTAGITSGVNGTLRVIAKFLGDQVTADLAGRIGYPDRRLDGSPLIPAHRITVTDAARLMLTSTYWWTKPSIGMALTDGVTEIELASVVDVYPGQAFTATVTTLAADGPRRSVTSMHGLTFVPRYGLNDAPAIDRILVPGVRAASAPPPALDAWARQRAVRVEYLHADTGGHFPFDATLSDLAATANADLARFSAKALEYPVDGLNLGNRRWPVSPFLAPLAVGLLALALAMGLDRGLVRLRAARRRRSATPAGRCPADSPAAPGHGDDTDPAGFSRPPEAWRRPAVLRAGAIAGLVVPLPTLAAAMITIVRAQNLRQNGFPWAAALAAVLAAGCTIALTGVHWRRWGAVARAAGFTTAAGLTGIGGFFAGLAVEDLLATQFGFSRFLSDNATVTAVGTLTASLLATVIVPLGLAVTGVATVRARLLDTSARWAAVLIAPAMVAGAAVSAATTSAWASGSWLVLLGACWLPVGRSILRLLRPAGTAGAGPEPGTGAPDTRTVSPRPAPAAPGRSAR